MDDLKHTPGPWKVNRRFDIYEDTQKPGIGGTFIGSTRGNEPLPESVNVRCEADARLMAEAPEMFRVVQRFAKPGWIGQSELEMLIRECKKIVERVNRHG